MRDRKLSEKGQTLAYDVSSAFKLNYGLKALISSVGNVLSFAMKLVVGILIGSPLWIANALYALIPGVTRMLCVYAENQPERVQKRCFRRAGLTMILTAVVFTVIVILRADEKQEAERLSPLVAGVLIAAIVVLFLLSLLSLRSSRKQNNRTLYMLGLVNLFSGLSNVLLVQRLALSIFTRARDEYVLTVNTWFGIGIGALMLLISLIVVLRNVMARYKKIELQ